MEQQSKPIKVLSTLDMTGYSVEGVEAGFQRFDVSTFSKFISSLYQLVRKSRDYDAIMFTSGTALTLLAIMMVKLLRPSNKIYIFDLILKRPRSRKEKIIAFIKRFFLKFVDCFMMINKSWSGYSYYYGVGEDKCIYIPFKANNYKIHNNFKIRNNGYALCCGASQRDIDTLVKAGRLTDTEIKILLPKHMESAHNTRFTANDIPSNVTIIREFLKRDDWYRYMAESFCVVIPIIEDTLQPAGISVYLEAMMFRKPVVITKGSSTEGILDDNVQAIMVPPNDPRAIVSALSRLSNDQQFYDELAENGYRYASSLQDHSRMVCDILKSFRKPEVVFT
ncbi:glycosyltransferase [Marinobacteraceae bacterium S3BR75-40.1]